MLCPWKSFEDHLMHSSVYVGVAFLYFCIRSALFFSFFCDSLPFLSCSPLFSPLAWSWLPGSWGLAKACVPGGAREEMERGGSKGVQGPPPKPQLQQPLLSSNAFPSCLAHSPALPLIRRGGYFNAYVFLCQEERCWLCEWATECLCVSVCADRELDGSAVMVWRPGSHNKAGEFTQRTKAGGRVVDRHRAWRTDWGCQWLIGRGRQMICRSFKRP